MIKLCGYSISNYYSKVHLVVEEKGAPVEIETGHHPSQDPEFLEQSPMGRVPFLVTPHGTICESSVICEYLEEQFPERPLLPRDPFARAKVRELVAILELYVELVARRLYPETLFGGKVSDETKAEVKIGLEKGVRAFSRVVKFAPYIAGAELTLADCATFFHLPTISLGSAKVLGHDPFDAIPQVADYLKMLSERPAFQKIAGLQRQAFLAMLASRAK